MNTRILNPNILPRYQAIQKFSTEHKNDLIGPANPVSNMRPMKFAIKENETQLERLLRKKREELQLWNEEFWTRHNRNFMREKEEYIEYKLKKKSVSEQKLSADELSVFYKQFLDKNWKNHFYYNANWHRQNFYVTFLDFSVRLQRLLNRLR